MTEGERTQDTGLKAQGPGKQTLGLQGIDSPTPSPKLARVS